MSGIFDRYPEHFNQEVRLVILKALAAEPDGRLNDSMIQTVLESFAINRTRDFLRTQLRWLAQEAQAVVLTEIGTAMIAELTEAGENHLTRKMQIEGIKVPSRRKG